MPFVSIIMNCFNSDTYLEDAINSVLSQNYQNWELIFWDNQSDDNSADIVNSINDPRIKYFYADKKTELGDARNLAVEKATSEWLAFLDCDDLWLPQKLEKQVAIALEEDNELGLIYGRMEIFSDNVPQHSNWVKTMLNGDKSIEKKVLPEGDVFQKLLKFNFIPLVSTMVRRSAYHNVGGIVPTLKQAEDYDLFLKISKVYKVKAIQSVICKYRVHEENLSHKNILLNFEESISILNLYLPNIWAKEAIAIQNTYFAIAEIKCGYYIQGIRRLIIKGNLNILIRKALSKLSAAFNDPDL